MLSGNKAGSLVWVPCEPGDSVYEILEETVPYYHYYIQEYKVQDVATKQVKYADNWEEFEYPNLFFTQKDAEDALRKQANKGVSRGMAQSNNGWIKAEEQLPDDGDCVLVLASGNVEDEILIEAYMLAEYYKGEGFILEQYPTAEDIFIEWWMSLPEPPEGVHR